MRARPLGRTGISVSELGLGTWGLSGEGYGPVEPAERDRVVDRALELGITLFDTADVYGDGAMERHLGDRLASHTGKTVVVTKVGTFRTHLVASKRFEPDYLREAVNKCRDRLRRPKLDVVLLHHPSMMTMTRGEAADVMKDLEREQCIEAWGVAAATKEVARAAIVAGAKVVEVPYNAFMSRDLHDLTGDLSIAGTGVLARSVLAYGLLAGHFTASRGFPAVDHRSSRWTRDEFKTRIDQLEALRPLVLGDVLSLRAVALRFVLVNQLVSSAVLGPRSMPQLEQLVREAGTAPPYLPEEGLSRLPALLEKAGVVT